MDNIDWKQAPGSAAWRAVDAIGKANWFFEPDVTAYTDFWFADFITAPCFGFEGDWRQSLTKRPGRSSGNHCRFLGQPAKYEGVGT